MRIGIYARGLSEKSGGTKRMIFEFTKRIISLVKDDDELFIFHNCDTSVFNSKRKNVKEIFLKSKNKIICDYYLGPKEIKKNKIDSLWISKVLIPFFFRCKTLVSITDLSSFYPKLNSHPYFLRQYMNIAKITAAKNSGNVHVISDSTKKDLIKFARIEDKKVKVVYLAADDMFHEVTDKEKLKKVKVKYNLPEKYLLFFGMISPRKNIKNLILAFEKNRPSYELIIAGGKGWSNSEIYELINKTKNVRHIGKVDEEDMATIYTLATSFVFPSFYEGFGLPIIEAQRCGCPVICSKTSSMKEIGKDSALFFDPENIEDIAQKIKSVMGNSSLRKKLKKEGFDNIKRFNWDEEAKEILEIIR